MRVLDWFWERAEAAPRREDHNARLGEAIETLVRGTDPRLRLLSNYQRKLRAPVERALAYADQLISALPGPLELTPTAWGADTVLRALFASPDHLREFIALNGDPAELLVDCVDAGCDPLFGILAATPVERTVFGHALQGSMVVADVRQQTVSFEGFHIAGLSATETGLRAVAEAWCFEQMVMAALARLTHMRGRRDELRARQQLLECRLTLLQRGGSGLCCALGGGDPKDEDPQRIREELERNARELEALATGMGTLDTYLHRVAEVLESPDHVVRCRSFDLCLDPMNIVVEPTDPRGNTLRLTEYAFDHPQPRRWVVFLVKIPRAAFPPPRNGLEEAMQLLSIH